MPLSKSNLIPKELGTRHRAAVGISEVTDALTIVISEETGAVTITKNNELIRNLTRQDYLKLLHNELVPAEEKKQKNIFVRFFNKLKVRKENRNSHAAGHTSHKRGRKH